jgi:sugar/nucleoside kinase (ribokinase family)
MGRPFEYVATTIGRAFTDVVADIDTAFLKHHRLTKGRGVEVTPVELLEIRSNLENYMLQPGGSPSNTAAGISALGGRAVFFGKVCDDMGGRAFRNAFSQGNVTFPTPSYPAEAGAISATCLVLTSEDDEVTMAYNRGVADRLTREDIVADMITDSAILLIQAHMLISSESRDATAYAVSLARKANRKVAITLNDLYVNPDQLGFLSQADIVLGNLREARAAFPGRVIQDFRNEAKLFIITDGERGATIAGQGNNIAVPSPELVPSAEAARPSFVGAGAQFCAGFLFGYAHHLPLEECARLGSETAAAVMRSAGARPKGDWTGIAARYWKNR